MKYYLKIFVFSLIFSNHFFAQTSLTDLRKIGDWNLYIEGLPPIQSFKLLKDNIFLDYNESYLFHFDKKNDSKISLKFIDTLEINSQRFRINHFQIFNKNEEYNLFVDKDIVENAKLIYPNVLDNNDVLFDIKNGIVSFSLGADFIGCKIKVQIDHLDSTKQQHIHHVYIKEHIMIDSLGEYLILITPRYSFHQ